MRKFILLFLSIFFSISTIHAQSTWFVIPSNTLKTLYSVDYFDANNGLLVGEAGKVMRTTNAGASWYATQFNFDFYLLDLSYASSNVVYAVGLFGKVCKSTDGGESWVKVEQNATNNTLYGVSFVNPNTGYAVGQYGTIIKTTNGGNHWTLQDTPLWWDIFDCHFFDANRGITCGSGGRILKTTNGGTNWFDAPSPYKFEDYWDLDFNGNTGYIVGSNGVAIKSVNGGTSWFPLQSDVQVLLNGVASINSTHAVAVGNAGTIILTTNGGNSFHFQTNPAFNVTLYSVDFNGHGIGTAIGGSGMILRTSNVVGVEPISSNVPDQFYLGQNYPNPFNPSTKIQFNLPKASLVTLKIYDMLGREIDELLNEQLGPGSYEAEWNAKSLTSGVYFYRLSADGFTEVKRMTLVK